MAKAIDCTPITWVQERSDSARENRARNYCATRKASKENTNEVLCGIILGAFIVGFFLMGMCM